MLNFEMLRPKTLEEALRMLKNNKDRAVPKSGGTDLLVWMKKRTIHPEVLIDLSRIEKLHQLSITGDGSLSIGTNVTLNEIDTFLRGQEILPALADACESHSDYTLRNKATLVGNVCASVPSGDMIPALCCHDA
ncbi:MAG TPA: xanthine dehydrogenase family protein subunit M, partial [Kosmotogaceae bacterium]